MKMRLLMLLSTVLFLCACGVHVVPMPTATGVVNPADNSIIESAKGMVVSARLQEMAVDPYRMVDNVTSFYFDIENKSGNEISVPLDSFILIDDGGNQYRPIPPSEIQNIVSRDSTYLIPYPYVGFYYLQDAERYSFENTVTTSLPFDAQNFPQDIYTEALPAGTILPGARISGTVYFLIELAVKKSFELRVYLPGSPVSGPADFTFPFSIEK